MLEKYKTVYEGGEGEIVEKKSRFIATEISQVKIGPSTIDVISLITSLKSLPSFAIRDGFVVTPQITPISLAALISSTFAVSIKNFMFLTLLIFACHNRSLI